MNKDYDTFVKLNGMECYECGSCTYVCPAKRPLTQSFKQARQYVAAQRRKIMYELPELPLADVSGVHTTNNGGLI